MCTTIARQHQYLITSIMADPARATVNHGFATWSISGLRARSFYGLRHITEVECSGDGLPASADLLSIVLYDADTNRVLASVNYAERKCVTSGGFTSCLVDSVNSRNTRVRMLIDDLRAEEVRTYGCDVSIFKAGERSTYVSWSLAVERPSKLRRPLVTCIYFIYTCHWMKNCGEGGSGSG